jgi:hypothetical protein
MNFRLLAAGQSPGYTSLPGIRIVELAAFVVERIGYLAPIESDSCRHWRLN